MKTLILLILLAATQPSQPPSPGGGIAQGQHQPAAADKHPDTQGAQRNSEPPSLVRENKAPRDHSVAAQSQNEGHWYSNPHWWVAGFTAALFVATAGLWAFTALMWLATRAAVADAARSTRIAGATLAHAKESSEQALRAYVEVDQVFVQWSGDGRLTFEVRCRNMGDTPARYFEIGIRAEIASGSLEGREVPDDLTYKLWTGLGSRAEKLVRVIPYPDEVIAWGAFTGLRSPNLVAFGRVRYRDIFDKLWETEFVTFTQPPQPNHRVQMSFANVRVRAYERAGEGQR